MYLFENISAMALENPHCGKMPKALAKSGPNFFDFKMILPKFSECEIMLVIVYTKNRTGKMLSVSTSASKKQSHIAAPFFKIKLKI